MRWLFFGFLFPAIYCLSLPLLTQVPFGHDGTFAYNAGAQALPALSSYIIAKPATLALAFITIPALWDMWRVAEVVAVEMGSPWIMTLVVLAAQFSWFAVLLFDEASYGSTHTVFTTLFTLCVIVYVSTAAFFIRPVRRVWGFCVLLWVTLTLVGLLSQLGVAVGHAFFLLEIGFVTTMSLVYPALALAAPWTWKALWAL